MKIYLAIAYTGHEEQSFIVANQTAGALMQQGHVVFSPISHTHPIAKQCYMPKDWDFWRSYDIAFIEWCDELWVCNFGDWTTSKGVAAEIELAKGLGKKVKFLDD